MTTQIYLRVTFDQGNSFETRFNGDEQTAAEYYIGQKFEQHTEKLATVVKLEKYNKKAKNGNPWVEIKKVKN